MLEAVAITSSLQLPRVFIQIVTIFDVSRLLEAVDGYCVPLHQSECPALFDADLQKQLSDRAYSMILATDALTHKPKYESHHFAVVAQPFLVNGHIPKNSEGTADISVLAADCFHFSAGLHSVLGINLWNSMLTPVSQKATSFSATPTPLCPTASAPYICTNSNKCGATA